MRRFPVIFILVLIPIWAGNAQGQLFGKKARPNPVQRVPELIVALKTDGDERKRVAAAAELREFDAKQFPEIMSVLMDVGQTDASANVRSEAISSLGKMRPITQEAGQMMEQASAKDASAKVRWQAKTSLWGYRLAGYAPGKNMSPIAEKNEKPQQKTFGKVQMTGEPPLADPIVISPGPLPKGITTPVQPPAADNKKPGSITPDFRPVSNPRPGGPGFSTAVPQTPRVITTPAPPPPPPQVPETPREINPLPLPVAPPAPTKDEGPPLTPPR